MSGLLNRTVTGVWQVGTRSGHIVFLLHHQSMDAWWVWGIHNAFDLWCELCRVALCIRCLYCGPSGHLTALAAVHQKTTGLSLREVGSYSASEIQLVTLNSTVCIVYWCEYYLGSGLAGSRYWKPRVEKANWVASLLLFFMHAWVGSLFSELSYIQHSMFLL